MSRYQGNNTANYLYNFSGVPDGAAPLTIVAWSKWGTSMATFASIVCIYNSGGYHYFDLGLDVSGYPQATARQTTAYASTHGTTVADTNWHHLAAVFASATSRTVYLDGVAGTENTSSATPASLDRISIGAIEGGADASHKGYIAHVAIYNVALSGSDIADLYNGGSGGGGKNPLAVSAANLVAYWPIAGTASPEPDSKGWGDLTIAGTMAYDASNPTVDDPPSTGLSLYILEPNDGGLR